MTLALAVSLALIVGAEKKGTIDGSGVMKTISAHMREIRGCYDKAEREKPGTGGTVTLKAVVNTSGDVVEAGVEKDKMKSETFNTCLTEAAKTWKFPPAKGGNATVTWPMGFTNTAGRANATETYDECMKKKKNQVECISEVENSR